MRRLLALLLSAVSLVAAPVPKESKAKPVSLNGTWEVVEWHANGNKEAVTSTTRWTIDGESLVIQLAGRGGTFRQVVNASYTLVRPKDGSERDLDYTLIRPDGSAPSLTFRGVVELDGDTLKFCRADSADGERPAECKAAQGTTMYVLKRVEASK